MKKIYNIFYILAAMLVFAACTPEQDDYFSESSAERVSSTIAADTKVLTSASNGWLMKYFPDENLQYGGYNVLLKFTEDGKVTVANELYDAGQTATSLYQVKQDAGVVLSFDTYNELFHLFSDPQDKAGVSSNGKGFEGDNDFQIIEASADKVVLKGKKSGTKAVLTPLTTDWTEYLTSVQQAEEEMKNNKYSFDANGTKVIAQRGTHTLTLSYEKDGEEISESVAYVVTPTGYEFYEPIEINGATIEAFTYDSASETFTATNDKSITMVKLDPSLSEQFVENEWFFYYSGLSALAQKYFAKAYEGSASEGEVVYYMYMSLANSGGFKFRSGNYVGLLKFSYTILSDDEVQIVFSGYDNNGQYYYSYDGYNYVASILGYSNSGAVYKLTSDDDLKNVEFITMTNEDAPSISMTVTSNVVYYPFKN
jgi:hypothetical protein